MEEIKTNADCSKILCCFGCLAKEDESALSLYSLRNKSLKAILQMEFVCLCYLCKRVAQRADLFIQTVQTNQKLLENILNVTDPAIEAVRKQTQPFIHLSYSPQYSLNIDHEDTNIDHPVVYGNEIIEVMSKEEVKHRVKVEVEDERSSDIEMSQEDGETDDAGPTTVLVKQEVEVEFPTAAEWSQTIREPPRKTGEEMKKHGEGVKRRKREVVKIKIIPITMQECLDERARLSLEKQYVNAMHKCELCVKGFTFISTYEKHMELHSEAMGHLECDICKQRMNSDEKLQNHMKTHQVRYKCGECGLTRTCRSTIKDHYIAYHRSSLKDSDNHPKEPRKKPKPYVCKECGLAFSSPSALKSHSFKHSTRRDYYCAECGKAFKSEGMLKQHMTKTAIHASSLELTVPCQYCDEKFPFKKALDRHINKIHLQSKPYECDRCDKKYVTEWSLTIHKRRIHEGYKPPLKYQCPMCDKAFDQNRILTTHIRTHTGERPFLCSQCPKRFSQESILRTHVKLIHLKLSKDGKPKNVSTK